MLGCWLVEGLCLDEGEFLWEKIKGCEGSSRRRYIEKAQVEYHPTQTDRRGLCDCRRPQRTPASDYWHAA